ncbi:MAG: MATE family efflux transporter [Candidatus Diapherotrites archaeon]
MRGTKNLTEGSIIKNLLILGWPIMLANVLQVAYQIVDMFWLGRLSTEAVASVSLSFPILFVLISLGMGMTMAGTILVAQYRGRNDIKNIDYVSAQTLQIMVFITAVLSVIGYFSAEAIVKLMGVEQSVLGPAISYLQISSIGFVFLGIYFVFQSLLRGVGDVKTPLYVVLATVIMNILLDPIFIFGFDFIPAMGVSGAALATILTQGVGALIGISVLMSGNYGIHIKKENFGMDFALMKKILFLGLPMSVEHTSRSLGMAIVMFLVAGFGTVAVAAFGISTRVFSIVFIPALGLSIANTAMVGQHFGAGKIERAEKIGKITVALSFGMLALAGLLCFIFSEAIAEFFIPGNLEVIKTSAEFIRIFSLSFGFIGIQLGFMGTFRGAGDTVLAMLLAICYLWILELPIAFILSQFTDLGVLGIMWAYPIANIIMAVIITFIFLKGNWKNKRIIEHSHAMD